MKSVKNGFTHIAPLIHIQMLNTLYIRFKIQDAYLNDLNTNVVLTKYTSCSGGFKKTYFVS